MPIGNVIKERKNTFEKGALLLVSTNLIAKVLGALYRIPLTNLLGVEGIGLYQLLIPTLLLALAVSSNFIPIVLSKCVAYFQDASEQNKMFYTSLRFVMVISGFVCIIVALLSKYLSLWQKEPQLLFCYLLLVPTIFLSGVKNVYRGWYFGHKEMLYPSISQLLEQVFKIAVSLTLAAVFMKFGLIYAVGGAVAGLFAGEVIGFVYFLFVQMKKHKIKDESEYSHMLYYRLVAQESMPIMFSGVIFPVVSFIDSFLIVNLLTRTGMQSKPAIMQYGLLQGPVSSLINLPIMIAISLSLAIIPIVSTMLSKMQVEGIKNKSAMSIKMCLLLVFPAAIGLSLIIEPTLRLLYPRLTDPQIFLCKMLFYYSAINIVFLSILEIINSILQGLGRAKFAAKSLVIGALCKIAIELFAVYYIGIYGVVISNIVFYSVSLIISASKYRSLVGYDGILSQKVGKVILCGVIMALVIVASIIFVNNSIIKIVVAIIVGVAIYIPLVIMLKVFSIEELKALPGGEKMINMFRNKKRIKYD